MVSNTNAQPSLRTRLRRAGCPTPNAERPIVEDSCVRFLPRRSFLAQAGFDVFLFLKGRVAESGLRHSTRNRAWGNPPWVRIPPLPPRWAVCQRDFFGSGLTTHLLRQHLVDSQ